MHTFLITHTLVYPLAFHCTKVGAMEENVYWLFCLPRVAKCCNSMLWDVRFLYVATDHKPVQISDFIFTFQFEAIGNGAEMERLISGLGAAVNGRPEQEVLKLKSWIAHKHKPGQKSSPSATRHKELITNIWWMVTSRDGEFCIPI